MSEGEARVKMLGNVLSKRELESLKRGAAGTSIRPRLYPCIMYSVDYPFVSATSLGMVVLVERGHRCRRQSPLLKGRHGLGH